MSVGWNVIVDDASAAKYREDSYFNENLSTIDTPDKTLYFLKMDSTERCTYLNKNGLCEMVITRGEDTLCNTCKNYPRLKKLYGGNVFFTLTFSCEAVIKHILKSKEDIEFEVVDLVSVPTVDDRYWIAKNMFTNETNFEIFNISMAILQNKEHRLYEKIAYLYMMYKNIDEVNKSDDQSINDANVDNILSQYLENLQNPEIFDVIKNVKTAENIFNKGSIIKALDSVLYSLREILKSQNPSTSNKIKNAKKLIEYSDAEVDLYNQKVESFLRNNEPMIEKFLILLMLESTFPSTFEKLEDAMNYILIRIFIIQSTLISLNIETETEITEDLFFESLRIISKTFEHSNPNTAELVNFVVTQKLNFKILMNIIL